jgi:hypothetical protein
MELPWDSLSFVTKLEKHLQFVIVMITGNSI